MPEFENKPGYGLAPRRTPSFTKTGSRNRVSSPAENVASDAVSIFPRRPRQLLIQTPNQIREKYYSA